MIDSAWNALDHALQCAIVRGDPPKTIAALKKARDQHKRPKDKESE